MHKNKQVAIWEAIWVVPVGFTYFFQNFDWYIDTFGSKKDQKLLFLHLWSFILLFWIVEFELLLIIMLKFFLFFVFFAFSAAITTVTT